jgi:putative nucleotidyltransferase with HDIG domain
MIQESAVVLAGAATLGGLFDVFVRAPARLREAYREGLSVLSGIVEGKDPRAAGHAARVADLSVRIATVLRMRSRDVERVRHAALLHDIGKVKVPHRILTKPDMLDPDEFALVKSHAGVGAEIISKVELLRPLAPIILCHHERPDGRGYPAGIAGAQIPAESRIIYLAAAYEAMTSPRSWRPPMAESDALEVIRSASGAEFDSDVAEAFFSLL